MRTKETSAELERRRRRAGRILGVLATTVSSYAEKTLRSRFKSFTGRMIETKTLFSLRMRAAR
jgi:hypothetical protein